MASEQEIINRIKYLKNIKPNQDWVILTKQRIIGETITVERRLTWVDFIHFIGQYRLAFASLALIMIISGGTMVLAQGALPGEPLYSVKKITEKGLAVLTGKNKVPAMNLELAERRLDEINQLLQKKIAKNLPAAVAEYQSARRTAKKEVAAEIKQNPAKAAAIVKQVGLAMQNIEDKERQVYGVLGLSNSATSVDEEIGSDQEIIRSLIEYFGKEAILSAEQQADLSKVRELYDAGNYSGALNYYLSSSLNK